MRESSRPPERSLHRALALAEATLAVEPAALLTDFDGTLSPIVEEPSRARLADGAQAALASLARRLAVVAIVTGREPLDARRLTAVPELLIVGNHGMEWLEPKASEPRADADASRIGTALDEVLARLPRLEGVLPEHKGVSASVHYRRSPDPDGARAAILEALGDVAPSGLELRDGRRIVEIRPVGLGDKGTATRKIVERYGLRGVVVMGDDLTDLDMFDAVAELRAAGRVAGTAIAVGGGAAEVPAEIAAAADAILEAPEEAAAFLSELARQSPPSR